MAPFGEVRSDVFCLWYLVPKAKMVESQFLILVAPKLRKYVPSESPSTSKRSSAPELRLSLALLALLPSLTLFGSDFKVGMSPWPCAGVAWDEVVEVFVVVVCTVAIEVVPDEKARAAAAW